ncbi:MAG: hypothetical protein ACREH5_03305 [Candidatus Omnitrophota bacterium]
MTKRSLVFLLFLLLSWSFSDPSFAVEYSYPQSQPKEKVVGPTAQPAEVSDLDIASEKEKEGAEAPGEAIVSKEEKVAYYPEIAAKKKEGGLPGSRVKMSGRYRLAAGVDEDFIVNDANADLQERNFRYIFGEDLNNTFDPAIYSQYLLNIDLSPTDPINFYTQIVADPWSYVGTTGEQTTNCDICPPGVELKYNLKYFGAFNSTINEIYRTNFTDSVAFPLIKVHDGNLTPGTVVQGFDDFDGVPGDGKGLPWTIPPHDLDYDFHPLRKLWMDYDADQWHARVFYFADEKQALTTDDPLELSNHKDYWQQSPWLYQYTPIQFFTDSSFKRGFYSDVLSFMARDSEGNRLVLLRGASFDGDWGQTQFAATVASPFTPWDENYYSDIVAHDNISGAARLKHNITNEVMIGSTYTFRTGLIDDSAADVNQVVGVDLQWDINKNAKIRGEAAGSHQERDLLTDDRHRDDREGWAGKLIFDNNYDHIFGHKLFDGHTDFRFAFTWMDKDFNPNLSRYTNTRDDHFWGNHITFQPYHPSLDYFRLGDGVDVNRYVFHIRWKEKIFRERFENLFDARNVHRASNDAYVETVIRDEVTYKINSHWTAKFMFRWHGLPSTTNDIEPFLSNFYFLGNDDPSNLVLRNDEVIGDRDADRFTYAGALQWVVNKELTAEAFVERTNNIPDFPRGLLNGTFRDKNDVVNGLLQDHLTSFLFGQGALRALPPYPYFTIVRERLIYKPEERLTYTVHAAQNDYEFWGGIDDNINHVGVSVEFDWTKKVSLFMDYTYSHQIDLPKLIATKFREFDDRDHHNVYLSVDYKIRPDQVFRAEYGVFGLGANTPLVNPYSTSSFSLPTIDTEHLLRVSLTGDF